MEDDPERYFDARVVQPDLGTIEREEREREEWLASPEAVQQREASWLAYGDLSPAESEELLRTVFAEQLQALNDDPARFLSDAQLIRPLDETAAAVKDEGERSVLDSSSPVRTENEEGDLAKVDLSLTETPQGYETANAVSDLRLPFVADEKAYVGNEGFSISQDEADESVARRFGDKNLLYPEVAPDTDLMLAPTSSGVELFNLLRSKESPEELRFDLELPEGGILKADGYGGAEVVRDEKTLTHISPPIATDAQGTNVPVELEVEQSAIVLHVAHRSGDYAAPILVDPIIEDWANTGNNWYEGKNLAALTNGAWKYADNNSGIYENVCCWGGTKTGLMVSFTPNFFFGPNQEGQWSYSTANSKVYIQHAWVTPFWRHDESCNTAQPHDYAGMLWGTDYWNPVVSNAAKNYGTLSLDGNGHAFIIGMGSGPPGVWISCGRHLYAGGVALWMDDDWPPVIHSASVPSGKWIGDQAKAPVTVSASDEGLGLRETKLTLTGKGVIAKDEMGHCTGLYGSRCPNDKVSDFDITGNSFLEGIRTLGVVAEDPSGKAAGSQFQVKVDNSVPEVFLSGQLAEATSEVGGEEKPAGTGDDLSLPIYKLKIEAKDGSKASDLTKRSGVKNIEVFLDGNKMSVPWSPLPSCPETSCAMAQTYTLNLTGLSAGKHTLEVNATDFVSEVGERDIEFEYFPATGIKDEYVMHYFPLPDGQGDESKEEHPARPELAVNVMNGNLVYRERDIDVESTAQVDLEVERYYNSMLPDSENTEWGDGWTLAETPALEPVDTGGSPAPDEAELIDQSGALEEEVQLPSEVGTEKFDPALQAMLTKRSSGGYELSDESGESATSVVFDATGQTEARLTDGYAKVDYGYGGGELSEIEVEDPSTFAADPAGLEIPGPELITAPVFADSFGSLGSAPGSLKAPSDVAIDASGNILVVDKSNNRIQGFTSTGQYMASMGSLGSGNGQFNRPTAIAIASNGDLWITDSGNSRVQRFSSAGAYLSKFGSKGTGNGQFEGSGPEGITIDASGNIWVSDTYGGRLQKFSSTGTFIKAVSSKGSGSGQLGEPFGLDVDAGGNVWVADRQNHRVSVFNNNGEFLSQFGSAGSGNGQFSQPAEIEIDKFGNVWVGDRGNNRIQRFDLAAQYKAKLGSTGSGPGQFNFAFPMGIAADSKGRLWIADSNNNRVHEWLAPIDKPIYASSFGSNGSGDGQFNFPTDVAVDLNGSLWATDKSNNRIEKFDSSGKFIAKYGSLGSANGQFNRPSSIAVDRDGNILVADSNNHRIQKLNTAGEFISKFGSLGSGNGQFNKPEEVVADFKGNIWVADVLNGRAQKFDEEGQFLKVIDSGQLYEPMGIDVDAGGNVWVADRNKNRISVFDSEGNFKSNVGSAGSGNGQFNKPDAVEIDSKGNVWVADLLNNRVQRFDVAGQYIGQFGVAGSGPGQFALDFPSGIATDREGHLWVTDAYNNRIQQWLTANYAPAQAAQLDLSDGDPRVEVSTPGGLVSSVSGTAAGEHSYEHEGTLLTSHDGPYGETDYDYEGQRLTKVTLPNGTWGQITYHADGRVKSVTVAPEGSNPKATFFSYSDDPRRTTVTPPDAPQLTYDIGADGSVLKWWNTQKPPLLDIDGSLYDNREKPGGLFTGDHWLQAEAISEEGITSLDVIANGNNLVDEKDCQENLETPEVECKKVINEWVTATELHAPGHLNLEVIATDRLGESTSERFWVDIPQPPPPPALGTPIAPKFRDIAKFREEYGLEVVFPVADELELNERISELIKDWHEPFTAAGQYARATMARWGVPLRPADVAELEYRERYLAHNGPIIAQWGEGNFPSSYAGYFMDHRAGGKIRIGFTASQSTRLTELVQQQGSLMATDRVTTFVVQPVWSLNQLRATSLSFDQKVGSQPSITSLLTTGRVSIENNKVLIGASNVGPVSGFIQNEFGSSTAIGAYFDPNAHEPRLTWMEGGARAREIDSRLFSGDWIRWGGVDDGGCTMGFSAWEEKPNPKPNGQAVITHHALTAGHCFLIGDRIKRAGYVWENGKRVERNTKPFGTVTRHSNEIVQEGFVTDIQSIDLDSTTETPRWIYMEGVQQMLNGEADWVPGQTLCYSGTYGHYHCGPTNPEPVKEYYLGPPTWEIEVKAWGRAGDSGGPVWNPVTGEAVGSVSAGPEIGAPTMVTPLRSLEGKSKEVAPGTAPGALGAPGMTTPGHMYVIDAVR